MQFKNSAAAVLTVGVIICLAFICREITLLVYNTRREYIIRVCRACSVIHRYGAVIIDLYAPTVLPRLISEVLRRLNTILKIVIGQRVAYIFFGSLKAFGQRNDFTVIIVSDSVCRF